MASLSTDRIQRAYRAHRVDHLTPNAYRTYIRGVWHGQMVGLMETLPTPILLGGYFVVWKRRRESLRNAMIWASPGKSFVGIISVRVLHEIPVPFSSSGSHYYPCHKSNGKKFPFRAYTDTMVRDLGDKSIFLEITSSSV